MAKAFSPEPRDARPAGRRKGAQCKGAAQRKRSFILALWQAGRLPADAGRPRGMRPPAMFRAPMRKGPGTSATAPCKLYAFLELLLDGEDDRGGLDGAGHEGALLEGEPVGTGHGDGGSHLEAVAVDDHFHGNLAARDLVDLAGVDVAGGEDVAVGVVEEDDEAGLDQGEDVPAFGEGEALRAALGDDGDDFLAAGEGNGDLVVGGAFDNLGDFASMTLIAVQETWPLRQGR